MTTHAPVSSQAQLNRIARGGALNAVGSLVAALSGLVLTAVVTNNWDPDEAGVLFTGTSLFLILSATALLGTDTGLARFLLRYEAQGRSADTTTVLRVALRPVAVAGVLLGTAAFVAAPALAPRVGLPAEGVLVLRVLAVALPLATVADACLAATRAYGRMRSTLVVDRLLRSGGQPVTVAAAALLGSGLAGLAVAWSLPYAAAALLAPLILVRFNRSRRAAGSGRSGHAAAVGETAELPARPVAQIRREFWEYTWARGLARVFQVGLQRADIVMVAALRSPAEAALYTGATRFVVLGQLGVQAVQQVLQPQLTQMLTVGDRAAVRRVFTTSATWIIALSWPVYVTAIVAAPLYLGVFGRAYVDAGELVVVFMGLAMLLAVAAGPVDVLLLMSGRSVTSLANNVAALAVNVGLNLVLIPRFGIEGAALAWATALAVRNLLPFWQVHRSLGVIGLTRVSAVVVAANLACFGAPMLVLRLTVGLDVVPAIAVLIGESAVYLALLWRMRGPLDLAAIRRPRRPRVDQPSFRADRGCERRLE